MESAAPMHYCISQKTADQKVSRIGAVLSQLSLDNIILKLHSSAHISICIFKLKEFKASVWVFFIKPLSIFKKADTYNQKWKAHLTWQLSSEEMESAT